MSDFLSKRKKLEDKITLFTWLLIVPVMFSFIMFIMGFTHQRTEEFIGTCFFVVFYFVVFIANKINEPFYFISATCIGVQIAGSIAALTYEEIIWPILILNILSIFFWIKIFRVHNDLQKLDDEHFVDCHSTVTCTTPNKKPRCFTTRLRKIKSIIMNYLIYIFLFLLLIVAFLRGKF